jgi:photosystem II stability/assembly factor-like uncharacterized protein
MSLLVILQFVSFPQEAFNWVEISSPTSQMLNKLSFIDGTTGWVEGEGGTIIRTIDGGGNWNTLYSAADTFMLDIFFLNENLGWVLFWDLTPPFTSKILKTSDGGLNWMAELCPGENTFFQSIYFLDSTSGFLAGSDIYKTSDGGINWFEVNVFDIDTLPPNFADFPVKKIKFYNNQIGYACGGKLDLAGVMWWTKDGGENWAAKGLGPDPINDIYIFDSLNVIGLGGDPEGFFGIGQVNTYDGGVNWSYNELNISGVVNAISFRTELEGWAVKDDKFLLSLDGGIEWLELNTPGNAILKDLKFTDSSTGYAVGSSGVILKYNYPITTADELVNKIIPNGVSLYYNYPNPFNPLTKINYSVARTSRVIIKVLDILGNVVETLIDEEKQAGTYKINWNAEGLPSGIYFYQLRAGSYVDTKKMILLK